MPVNYYYLVYITFCRFWTRFTKNIQDSEYKEFQ